MPDIGAYQFDSKAAGELLEVLKWWKREHSVAFFNPPEYGEPRTQGDANDKWLRLTSNLDAIGSATGNLLTWNGSGYDVASGSSSVVDYHGNWGLEGESIRVLARGDIYEATSSGPNKHTASLTSDLTDTGTATATVATAGGSATITVYYTFVAYGDTIVSGESVAVYYDVGSKTWIADNGKCG